MRWGSDYRLLASKCTFFNVFSNIAYQYNGFNLILADVNSGTMVYISNRPGGDPVIQTVAPGLHVLSNGAIDSPWPKVRCTFILCRYYD